MPYYHNQRVYGGRSGNCQNPRPARSAVSDCREEESQCIQARQSRTHSDSCGDDTNSCCSLAVANVINQKSNSPTFDVERALIVGTIYKELDKPFLGEGGCRR